MDFVSSLPAGTTGGFISSLAAQFVIAVLRVAGKQIRSSLNTDKKTQALQKAVTASLTEALSEWAIDDEESEHYQSLFQDWLLNPAVLGEFRTLLSPSEDSDLDFDFLQEEFEATGLSVEHFGRVSFDVLLQDMVGAFYLAAAEE